MLTMWDVLEKNFFSWVILLVTTTSILTHQYALASSHRRDNFACYVAKQKSASRAVLLLNEFIGSDIVGDPESFRVHSVIFGVYCDHSLHSSYPGCELATAAPVITTHTAKSRRKNLPSLSPSVCSLPSSLASLCLVWGLSLHCFFMKIEANM